MSHVPRPKRITAKQDLLFHPSFGAPFWGGKLHKKGHTANHSKIWKLIPQFSPWNWKCYLPLVNKDWIKNHFPLKKNRCFIIRTLLTIHYRSFSIPPNQLTAKRYITRLHSPLLTPRFLENHTPRHRNLRCHIGLPQVFNILRES